MYNIAAFDFDGTLTRKDTLLEFIKFVKGRKKLLLGFLLHAPILCAYKLRLYPNWKAKQRLFSYYFSGMRYDVFQQYGREFSGVIDTFVRHDTLEKLRTHKQKGDRIYVISASIDDWVRPWCMSHGVDCVLGTGVEVNEAGCLTGRFSTPNCYGAEKVRRLLAVEPHRSEYILTAYGDSAGDKPLLHSADFKHWVK